MQPGENHKEGEHPTGHHDDGSHAGHLGAPHGGPPGGLTGGGHPPYPPPMAMSPFGPGPPPFFRMSMHLSKPDPRDSEVELKDSYQVWEYFVAPRTQKELLHRYWVLKRTMFGQDPIKEDPNSTNLMYWFTEFVKIINDIRMWNVENIDIKWRFYLAYPLALSPLFLFRKHKFRRLIPSTILTWYFVLPEETKAIIRAK